MQQLGHFRAILLHVFGMSLQNRPPADLYVGAYSVWRISVKFLAFCRAAAVVLTVIPSVVFAAVPEVMPGKDFVGMGYSLSSSGNVVVYAGVREISGKVGVCGMVWYENATSSTRAVEARFTEKMTFKIGSKGLSVSTRAFNRFNTQDDAQIGKARCSVTTAPWKPEYGKAKLTMNLGQVTIYE